MSRDRGWHRMVSEWEVIEDKYQCPVSMRGTLINRPDTLCGRSRRFILAPFLGVINWPISGDFPIKLEGFPSRHVKSAARLICIRLICISQVAFFESSLRRKYRWAQKCFQSFLKYKDSFQLRCGYRLWTCLQTGDNRGWKWSIFGGLVT